MYFRRVRARCVIYVVTSAGGGTPEIYLFKMMLLFRKFIWLFLIIPVVRGNQEEDSNGESSTLPANYGVNSALDNDNVTEVSLLYMVRLFTLRTIVKPTDYVDP